MTTTSDWDEFRSYRASGGGGKFLGNWKEAGEVDVWIHTQCPPVPFWHHAWRKIESRQDKTTKAVTREVWSDRIVCVESPVVLRNQYRFKEGVRESPPVSCPMCRMVDAIRLLVRNKKLGLTAKVFAFQGGDKAVAIHAGGIYCGFKGVEAGTEDAKLLGESGIALREAWKEDGRAKLSFIFRVLVGSAVADGIQIAIETGLLGTKVQSVINKSIKGAKCEADPNGERGNLAVRPFAMQWSYDAGAIINEKYDAMKLELEAHPLTAVIERAIRGPAPSIDHLLAAPDFATLRARLEHAALPEVRKILPWDEIFDVPRPKEDALSAKETIPCDRCQAPMDPKAPKCVQCGTEYDVEDEPCPF